MLRQGPANELAREFAKKKWVKMERKKFAQIPAQCHGIPHSFVPGVHSNLDYYVKSVEKYREVCGRSADDTVDSVVCLPFSTFSQVRLAHRAARAARTASRARTARRASLPTWRRRRTTLRGCVCGTRSSSLRSRDGRTFPTRRRTSTL